MENLNLGKLNNKVKTLPLSSGVYLMKNADGVIIYVGKAKKLRNRVKSYFDNSPKNLKTQIMASQVFDFDYILTDSELDAFNLENTLIKKYMPKYNILLKDDKSFPYIYINRAERFPRIQVVRRPKQKKGLFGPFVTGMNVYEVLDAIKSAFKIRVCNKDFSGGKMLKRACLHGEIGDCCCPCILKVSEEEYNKIIDEVEAFLNGKTSAIKKLLTEKMEALASEEKFEDAIKIRSQLESINKLDQEIITDLLGETSIDVFGYYSSSELSCFNLMMIRNGKNVGQVNFPSSLVAKTNGEALVSFIGSYYLSNSILPKIIVCSDLSSEEVGLLQTFLSQNLNQNIRIIVPKMGTKLKLCSLATQNAKNYVETSMDRFLRHQHLTIEAEEELAQILGIKKVNRIEGYDISNISGTNSVASMVVFEDGEPKSKDYRKFKIKTVVGANDFASLAETLERRLNHLLAGDEGFNKKPDVILIDGGIGQLNAVKDVINANGLDIPVISLAKQDEEVFTTSSNLPLKLDRNNNALKLLQRVRDESHRFAVNYHRALRGSKMASNLTKVNGIGEKRLNLLYKHFKTLEDIMNATPEDIAQVEGFGKKTAITIYNGLHKEDKKD